MYFSANLYPRIPLVSAIFPKSSFTAADVTKVLDRANSHHILGVFVTQLSLNAQSQRCAVGDGQPFAVELIGENCLRMKGVNEIDTLVVRVCTHLQSISTIKHDVTCARVQAREVEHCAQRHARPLAYGAPPLYTTVASNLRARRHRTQMIKRQS